MPRRTSFSAPLRELVFEPVGMRIPDRAAGRFGEGRVERLVPPGRPSDLYGDVIVSVARVRAMEGRP